MQEWTYRHGMSRVNIAGVDISARCGKGGQCGSGQIGMSRVDIAGVEISAPCGRDGQCRSGHIGTMWQGWTMREVRLT